jgi:hypothetical protein
MNSHRYGYRLLKKTDETREREREEGKERCTQSFSSPPLSSLSLLSFIAQEH